ncbi:3-deoxy-7-phosphoheptulonate synthase [Micromonospora sp. RB23]
MKPPGLLRRWPPTTWPTPEISGTAEHDTNGLDGWRGLPRAQRPPWPDEAELAVVMRQLATVPPLVTPAEVDELRDRLAVAAEGRAFLLEGGDPVESSAGNTEAHLVANAATLAQMALVLAYGGSMPVVSVARAAGGCAHPAAAPIDHAGPPGRRGDLINDRTPAEAARIPDPQRLILAYANAAGAMNVLRAHFTGDLADLQSVHRWQQGLLDGVDPATPHLDAAQELGRAMAFIRACGVPDAATRPPARPYSSHDALVLEYERPLVRAARGRRYGLSGHLLGLSEHVGRLDGAHVDLVARIANPVTVTLGPDTLPEATVELCERLNPDNVAGRLTLTCRIGPGRIDESLPPIVEKVTAAGRRVLWQCDPMAAPGTPFARILEGVRGYFAVHRALCTHPGGLRVALDGDRPGTPAGGGRGLARDRALDLAYQVAELLKR